jgi:uncharacterized protein (DUF779 family)
LPNETPIPDTQVILNAVKGLGCRFSLDNKTGKTFQTSLRLFTAEKWAHIEMQAICDLA